MLQHISLKNKDLSIYLGPSDYPYHLYLNGKKILTRGTLHPDYVSNPFESVSIDLPDYLLQYGDSKNYLVYQAYPVSEVTPLTSLVLTSYKEANKLTFNRNFAGIYFVRGAAILGMILFVFFLIYGFIGKTPDFKYIFFSLMCLSFSMAYFEIALSHNSSNEVLLKILSKTGFTWTTIMSFYFVSEFTEILNRNRYRKIIPAVIGLILTILFFTRDSKAAIDVIYGPVTQFVFFPAILINITLLSLSIFKYKNKSSIGKQFSKNYRHADLY